MKTCALMWFRDDLRLRDNPAFAAAAASGLPLLCVYVDRTEGVWRRGGASRVALASALTHLERELARHGLSLHVLALPGETQLVDFARRESVAKLYCNRRYDRHARATDDQVRDELAQLGVGFETFRASVLREPSDVHQASGKPYLVYTPFLKVYERDLKLEPLVARPEGHLPNARDARAHETVEHHRGTWLPRLGWDAEMRERWVMSEDEAQRRLETFLDRHAASNPRRRDLPSDEDGTSRLSPYLALGVISPRQIFWHITGREDAIFSSTPGIYQYQKEIIWREFAYHLIYHFPHTDVQPLRENFARFPWEDNEIHFDAWSRGQTGYPIVDAAMRELWTTGYMHNRCRMIVASFLVKHLRLPWLRGARWFWDTLVDADLASNTLGWQWSAGCGADAAPYFRIFNPVLQGERFDARGDYVRRWVPELAGVGPKHIHQPWTAGENDLRAAGVRLGETYPFPIVDHRQERARALAAFKKISGTL